MFHHLQINQQTEYEEYEKSQWSVVNTTKQLSYRCAVIIIESGVFSVIKTELHCNPCVNDVSQLSYLQNFEIEFFFKIPHCFMRSI